MMTWSQDQASQHPSEALSDGHLTMAGEILTYGGHPHYLIPGKGTRAVRLPTLHRQGGA